jgi:hypothetical protein
MVAQREYQLAALKVDMLVLMMETLSVVMREKKLADKKGTH